MFVGDSLNRNQWESMICLVQSVIPQGKKRLNLYGALSVFTIEVCFFSRCTRFNQSFESFGSVMFHYVCVCRITMQQWNSTGHRSL